MADAPGTVDDGTVPELGEELEEGRAALAEGDVDEAMMRAARALAVAPTDPAACAFADEVIGRHPDPLRATEPGPQVAYGIVALRARALALHGRWREAIDLALQLAGFRPHLPFAEWASEWMVRAPPVEHAGTILGRMSRLLEAIESPPADGAWRNATAAIAVLDALPPKLRAWDRVSFVKTALLRRLGRFEEAFEVARSAFSAYRSWVSAVALGNAARDAGHLEQAVLAFDEATQLDHADASAWVDLASLHGMSGNWVEAERCSREALARDAHHSLARLLHLGARARQGDCEASSMLSRIASDQGPDAERARSLLGT